jgi:hypothetical protein
MTYRVTQIAWDCPDNLVWTVEGPGVYHRDVARTFQTYRPSRVQAQGLAALLKKALSAQTAAAVST